jgi:hypothetical protein
MQAVMSSSTRPGDHRAPCGVRDRHAAFGQLRAQQPLADDLDRQIQHHHQRDRDEGRARHVARRIVDLARRYQRGFHPRVSEHHQHHRSAERAPRGHVAGRKAHLRPVDQEQADAGEQEQRGQFQRGECRDRSGAELDAEDIEREKRSVHRGQQQPARQGRRKRGHEIGDLDRQGRGHARTGGEVADPHQRAGDEAREWAEGRAEIAVRTARNLHAAADRGEAERNRNDRERTGNQRQGRSRAHLGGEGRRHAKDAAAHDHVDHRRRQREESHRAQQRGVALQWQGVWRRGLVGHGVTHLIDAWVETCPRRGFPGSQDFSFSRICAERSLAQ